MKRKMTLFFGMMMTLAALIVMPLSALATGENETPEVVVPKELNTGLYRDIYAFVTDKYPSGEGRHADENRCYFFMPYGADLTQITYTAGGETKTLDLSENKTETITLNGTEYKALAYKSVLPTMYLEINEEYGTIEAMENANKHSEKCYGDMRIEVPDDVAEENGWEKNYVSVENKDKTPCTIELRGRGNSSWTQAVNNKTARPYQVKLEKSMDIMGMGAAKSYTLLKADQLQSTAKAFLNMGTDMGVAFTPSAELVTVYLNGEYRGMYTLSEKVEVHEERVNISNLEDEIDAAMEAAGTTNVNDVIDDIDITGGYLLEIDNSIEDLQFRAQTNYLTIKSPENLDVNSWANSNYAYIMELMTDLFNAVYGDGYLKDEDYAGHPGYAGKHFTEVMDMDSVTKYFLEQELSANADNCLGSTFFYKDKDSIDGKIRMSPVWDNDRCCSLPNGEGWLLPTMKGYHDNPDGSGEKMDTFFAAMCKHKEFLSYVVAYYEDNTNYNNIKQTFEEYANGTKNEELRQLSNYIKNDADMTRYRWNYDYSFVTTKLPTYLTARKAWVDANIETIKEFGTKGEFIEKIENTVPKPDGKIVLNTDTATDGKINVSIASDLGMTQTMDVYTAVYDTSGALTKVFLDEDVTVEDGENYTNSYDYTDAIGRVKTMLWEPDKIVPIDRVVNES